MDRAAARVILLAVFLIPATSDPVKKAHNVDVYSFHMNSTVTSRYATTTITSRVANKLDESQEILFEVKIPKNAFISKFRMIIEGTSYDGDVKEKAEAQQQYTQAVSRGQSAGLIKSVGRTLEEFKTSVTVAALSKVTFELTYEELLKRRLGKYELLINAQPMQTVTDFKIDVHIHEKTGISFLDVKGDLSTDDLTNAIKTTRADKDAWVTFYPTRDQQTKCKTCGENGLNGDLLITYDVKRQNPNGEMTVSNGYFFHSFAPSDVSRIPKNVVFIIDRSGSMHGKKMEQTRLALLKILSDLGENDHFGLITFDSRVDLWKRELLKATQANLEDAKSFVKKITDRGATDINAAVLEGVNMITRHPREGTTSILILLTDGDPTSGETDTEKITGNVKEAVGSKFPLYCLGFGYDVNFDFLTKMSLGNDGVARRIYEDSDADLQLQGFYDEVAVPLLTDIQLNYTGVSNLTQTSFNLYFNGSEIVVSGQITDNSVESVTTEIIAISKGSKVTYRDTVTAKDVSDVQAEHDNFLERLWAYLTVKQLLDRQVLLKGPEKEASRKEALNLSLKYQFVTSLTSMVVTKPQENQTEVADKPKEGETPHRPPPHRPPVSARPGSSQRFSGRASNSGSYGSGRRGSRLKSSPAKSFPNVFAERGFGGMVDADFATSGTSDLHHALTVPLDPFVPVVPVVSLLPLVHVVPSHRFLLPADNQSKPLCFAVPLPYKLKLLEDSSIEFSMNGESGTSGHGFSQIAFHFKKTHHLVVNTMSINHQNDQENEEVFWGPEARFNKDGVSVLIMPSQVNITMGDFVISVLLHNNGDLFLWPKVEQYPQGSSPTGILGKASISYGKMTGSRTPTLKIMDKEMTVSRAEVRDYSITSAPVVKCWLVPFEAVMNGNISDFTVTLL